MKRISPWLDKFAQWRTKNIGERTFLVLVAMLTGIITSILAVLLKVIIRFVQHLIQEDIISKNAEWSYMILPFFGILLCSIYVQRYLSGNLGRGTGLLLVDISKNNANIPKHKLFSQMISSVFTVSFGGSAGLEAPIVVTGSAYGSNLGKALRMTLREKTILIACGAAAGISAIFNCPTAGVIFAMEVILARVTVPVFIPILIASATSAVVSKLLYTGQPFYRVTNEWTFSSIPYFIVLGLICGLLSVYSIRVFSKGESFFVKLKRPYLKSVFCGALLGMLIFVFPPLYGEGYPNILNILHADYGHLFNYTPLSYLVMNKYGVLIMAAALMLTKVFATMFTIGGGGNGGMFGSSLFAGSFLGLLFVEGLRMMGIAELDHVQFIVVAMAGLLSGVIHAPLTAIFLIAEITGGYTLFVPLMIVSALSYFVTKYFEPYSVYTRKLAISGELVLNNPDFEVLNHLHLKDLVEKDFTPVLLSGTLRDLIKVIPESKRNLFPVVDHFNQFHGVILLDDIRALMFKPEKYDTLMIRDLMQRAPAELEIKEPMSAVMKKFEDTQAWNLPVLVGMKYEGFVSKSAIFSNYRNQLIEDLVKE